MYSNPNVILKDMVEVSGRKLTVKVEIDSHDAESPREWSNLGRLACSHRRYKLGDSSNRLGFDMKNLVACCEGWEEVEEHLIENYDAQVILPVFMYDHSGIALACSPFGCRWDSGQVGFIYVTNADLAEEFRGRAWTEEEVRMQLTEEVRIYSSYVNGDVYGYVIEDERGERLDSCWGFIGEAEYAMKCGVEEAKCMIR
jgi:hypothetical protein